jgi:hypothetical protein
MLFSVLRPGREDKKGHKKPISVDNPFKSLNLWLFNAVDHAGNLCV